MNKGTKVILTFKEKIHSIEDEKDGGITLNVQKKLQEYKGVL